MDENNRILDTENIDKNKDIDEISYDEGTFSEDKKIIFGESNEKKNFAKEVYEWISSLAAAVVIAFVINTFLFSLVQVDGSSMVPTLHHSERLIVRKIAYTPQNSDVVIIKSEPLQKYIVKRIIGTPMQKIDFDYDLNITIDDKTIDEPYIEAKQITFGYLYDYPIVVPKKGELADIKVILAEEKSMPQAVKIENKDGKIYVTGSSFIADGEFEAGKTAYTQDGYFVLGDNRNNSSDSRVFGLVPKDEIVGEAIFRFYPFNVMGSIK